MKFLNYLIEKKKLSSTMIGFGINDSDVKRQYDYIKDQLNKNKIRFDDVENKHISMAMIKEKVEKDELVRFINEISNKNLTFMFKDYTMLEGRDWNFIVLEFKRSPQFLELFNKIDSKYDIVKFKDEIRPHSSLFKLKKGKLSFDMFNDIVKNAPKLKGVKPTKVELWNNKFDIEFIKRMK